MRKRGIVSSSCRFLSLALVFAWATTVGFGQQPRMDASHMPAGGWSVAFRPSMAIGHELDEVVVGGVKSELTEGIGVTELWILNRSQQPLTGVQFAASLARRGEEDAPLREIRTKVYSLPEAIEPNEVRRVQFRSAPVTFLDLSRPYVREGILTGDYVVQIAVTEARFQDHSRWRIGSWRKNQFRGARVSKAAYTQDACPHTECAEVERDGIIVVRCLAGPFGLTCGDPLQHESCLTLVCGINLPPGPGRPPILQ